MPLEGAFIRVITLGLMFHSHFTFLGGELEGKSIKTLDTNFVSFLSTGFILRLDNKKLLRIWQNLFLHWHLASFFFLACLKNNDKDTITETRASKFWMDDEICTIFYHLYF